MYKNVNMITCDNVNCYVIRGEYGDILIDTGLKKYRNEIETWLLNYDIKLIVLTHGHNDHIENAAYFSELYNAPIAMHREDEALSKDNLCRGFYAAGVSGYITGVLSEKKMSSEIEPFKVDIYPEDGERIGEKLGSDTVVVTLPGHTRGSIGLLNNQDLYVGDAVMNYFYPNFPYICESPKETRASINKIHTFKPKRLFFGHGKPIKTEHNPKYINLFSKNIIM